MKRFIASESGSAIEYGLIASLITILLIAAMITMGEVTGERYEDVASKWTSGLDNSSKSLPTGS